MANTWKTKFLVILVGIIVAIATLLRYSGNNDIIEHFWSTNAGFSVVRDPVASCNGKEYSLPNTQYTVLPETFFMPKETLYQRNVGQPVTTFAGNSTRASTYWPAQSASAQGPTEMAVRENFTGGSEYQNPPDHFFTVPGQYQSNLSPRFSNIDYGANINYNMPAYANQGVPENPLDHWNSVEKFEYPTNSSSADYIKVSSKNDCAHMSPNLPVTTMGCHEPHNNLKEGYQAHGGQCNPQDVCVYDRLIYGLTKNRQLAGSDYFRGDLAIAPNTNYATNWFLPAANMDMLNTGCLAVLGGGTQAGTISALKLSGSGNTLTSASGTDMALTQGAVDQIAAQTSGRVGTQYGFPLSTQAAVADSIAAHNAATNIGLNVGQQPGGVLDARVGAGQLGSAKTTVSGLSNLNSVATMYP